MSEKYAEKIAALLAKAESTDNTAEAETFTKAAERLMLKWGIDDAKLEAARKGKDVNATADKIVQTTHMFTGIYHYGLFAIGSAVGNGLGNIKVMISKGRSSSTIFFVGFESDIARALQLTHSLVVQAEAAMRAWWKTSEERTWLRGMEAFKARRQFFLSFAAAVGERLREARCEEVAEAGSGTDLVLVDRGRRVQDYVRENYSLGRARGSIQQGSAGAESAGFAAGQRASFSRAAVDR